MSHTKKERLLAHKQWLLSVGNGSIIPVIPNTNIIEIPHRMSIDPNKELLARVYPNFETNYNNPDYLSKQAIMSTSNKIVQQCNFEMVEKFQVT